ncbi:hypothetical protein ACLKA6_000185 [Drosophila palustris]
MKKLKARRELPYLEAEKMDNIVHTLFPTHQVRSSSRSSEATSVSRSAQGYRIESSQKAAGNVQCVHPDWHFPRAMESATERNATKSQPELVKDLS